MTGALTGHARSTGEERRRFGKGHEEKAATAVARTLICIAWAVMARGQDYADAGEDYYDQRDQRDGEHLIRHHQHALARLGCQVTLIPPGDSSPPARRPDRQPASPAAVIAGSAGAAARLAGVPEFVTGAFVLYGHVTFRGQCWQRPDQMSCMSHAGRPVAGPAWRGMAGLRGCAGSMLWLSRKMLSGSWRRLTWTSRS